MIVTDHQKRDVGLFDKLISMQLVDIQRRPIIYSTCVQRLPVHTPIYSSPSLSCRTTTFWPSERNTVQSFHPLAESHLKKPSYEDLPPLFGFHHLERMVGGERQWEERAWGCGCGDSSREPSWVLPWPEVKNRTLSGKLIITRRRRVEVTKLTAMLAALWGCQIDIH